MEGIIQLNKRTEGHLIRLLSKGYEVQVDDDRLIIKCNGFHNADEIVDATSMEKLVGFFKQVIKNKKLVPYNTRFLFEDGKELSAPFNLTRLGDLSAFVAKPRLGVVAKVYGLADLDLVE